MENVVLIVNEPSNFQRLCRLIDIEPSTIHIEPGWMTAISKTQNNVYAALSLYNTQDWIRSKLPSPDMRYLIMADSDLFPDKECPCCRPPRSESTRLNSSHG